ncbi:MAG: DUF805 domain-containing protein [Candidatus Poribacteria bacterium]|nr:DUF805 domain-containing protein [Candidatus Poribacteria bacterium]
MLYTTVVNNADGYDGKSMKYQSLLEDLRYLLFSFRGRITRSEWWIYVLLRAGVFLVPAVILLIKKGTSGIPNVYGLTNLWEFFEYAQDNLTSLADAKLYVSLFLTFFLMFIDAAAITKRFHDINLSGWLVLLGCVPIFGPFYIMIYCGFIKGTQGDNRYGKNLYRDISEDQTMPQPQAEG